jgi:hypothetical protein
VSSPLESRELTLGDDLIGVLILIGLAILAAPVVVLVLLLSLRSRVRVLEETIRQLTKNDQAQRTQLAELLQERKAGPAPERVPPKPEPGATPEHPLAPVLSLVRPIASAEATPPPAPVAVVQPAVPIAAARVASGSVPPPTPPPRPPRPPQAPLEERIAFWFTRAGAAAFLLGIAYFFKYAVDNDWIGPTGRVLLGAFVGAAILAVSELLWQRALTTYTRVVEGVGLCVLMATTYSSFALYHLVSVPIAFLAVGVVALLGGALAAHHRSEPILLLSLLGALLAPVILSTGHDNPLGLFSYLLLVGSLANWVALRERFALTPALGIAGTVALFVGWYLHFFDFATEPYVHLQARVIPLASVALFSAAWITLAWAARRRGHDVLRPVWLEVAALVFAHGGAAMLLFDHAPLLGGVFVALAAVSAAVLRQEDRRELLVIPLLVSFVILVWLGHALDNTVAVRTLVILGIWTTVYAAEFLRGRVNVGQQLPLSSALLAAVSIAAFGIFGAILLFDAHPMAFGGLLALLSVPLVGLADLAAIPLLIGGAAVASFAGLVSLGAARRDPMLLVITGGWALVYAGTGAWDLLRRKARPTAVRLAVISGAGLGFVGLVLQQTSTADGILRAALFGLVGMADLLLGIALLRARAPRSATNVFLAQALALFFVAVALLLSGVSITIAWAAMATTCAVLAAREKDRDWVSGSVALFAVTLGRIVSIDWQMPDQLRRLFLISRGVQGALAPHFLLNPRALALVSVAAGLAIAGRALSKLEDVNLRIVAAVFISLAHTVALALILTEARGLALKLPQPPQPPLEPGAWESFQTEFYTRIAEQTNAVSVLMTILLGIYSLALLGAGFGLRDVLHRYLGLGLFGLTLGKLGLWDIWQLPRTYQIATLVGVGALLLVASFLYANRRSALASLWKGGVGLLLFVSLGRTARADASLADLARVAPISGVNSPGLYVARISPSIWRASRNGLNDLRVADASGNELPFFVRTPPASAQQHDTPVPVHMVDPVTLPKGGFRATFVQGPKPLPNNGVVLTVDGSDFLRTARIESSTNGHDFGVLEEGPLVYRISGARDQLTVHYPESEARFLRITLLPRGDGQEVRISGGSLLVVNPHAPVRGAPPETLLDLAASGQTQDKQEHRSHFEFDAGEPGVPLNELRLTVKTPAFERRATVLALNSQQEWVPVGSGVLFRADDEHGNRSENTTLGIQTDRGRLRVDIDDGDDPPLVIEGAKARAVNREIMFRADKAGPLQLFVGDEGAPARQYDLKDVFDRAPNATLTEAFLGVPVTNPAFKTAAAPAAQVSWTDQHKTLAGLILGGLLLALAGWTALLLRKSKGEAAE